ncbi:hypothetical protein A6R68_00358 [Neotoma lepida]|uniref:Testis-expressed protein 13 A-D N-terminal domain-containing protein n=1 Tax=Neotoma lepida TaxID=56216 RepID=A0A1A6GYP3_NEOLE|nr:hypothetical protein A6R68_00358 [Neotoma lepida]
MAVDLGDYSSGFRHSEVVRFINNEILTNGGGPEFYRAFRMRPWNEIEDRLRAILINPQVPCPLKRACTWSALALSVRIGERQREQQAHMVGQDTMGQHPSAPRAPVSELWQLRQQRDEAITQLLSTQAALQQATRECALLRRRLDCAERSPGVAPLVQNTVPGAQSQQLGDTRDTSQEGGPGKTQETDTMRDNRSHIQEQGPRRTQKRTTLVHTGNDEERETNEDNREAAAAVLAEAVAAAAVDDDTDAEEKREGTEEKAAAAAAADNTIDSLQSLQELHLPEEDDFHSQSEKCPQASALPPLGSGRSQIKEGVKEILPTCVQKSWSQVVRESPKKQQPQLRKDRKPQPPLLLSPGLGHRALSGHLQHVVLFLFDSRSVPDIEAQSSVLQLNICKSSSPPIQH